MNPPADADRSPPLFVRGRWAIVLVAAFLSLAALFLLFNLRRTALLWLGGKMDDLWAAGDVFRAGGALLLMVLVGRYAAAVRKFNREGEPAAAALESAHAALWRLGALLLVVHLLHTAVVLTRATVPPPVVDKSQED